MNSRLSSSDSPPLPETVAVGRVRKPHGVRGEVVVAVHSDVKDRFSVGSVLSIVLPNGELRQARVASVRGRENEAIIRFSGIENRDEAEALRGSSLEIALADVPQAPSGSYYFFELVGCLCVDAQEGELGRVVGVLEDGGGLILEVESGSKRLLVPFVEAYLDAVQVDGRRIDLNLPKGLIETCTSES